MSVDPSDTFHQPGAPGSPLALLAQRARDAGYEPWLFHRDGWDWCWRSWAQAADQVARGAAALRRQAAGSQRAGHAARQHPDAVAAGLAIRAAGVSAMPVRGGRSRAARLGCEVWVEVGDAAPEPEATPGRVMLPPALSPIEKAPLEPLVLEATPGPVRLPDLGELSPAESIAAAERLDGSLATGRGRPVVCAAPDLEPPDVHLLETWTLVRGAAWVLEPQASAFVETVLWARPTVVWAPAAELERLVARIATRKHRRHSRVASVVVARGEAVDPGPWNALGVEVLMPHCGINCD